MAETDKNKFSAYKPINYAVFLTQLLPAVLVWAAAAALDCISDFDDSLLICNFERFSLFYKWLKTQ